MSLIAKTEININPRLKEILMEGIVNGIYKATNIVHKDALHNSPVHLGRLKNSISQEVDEKKAEGSVYSNVEYAPYVEFGDLRGAKPKHVGKIPFLRPALYDNQDKILNALNSEVEKKLK